MDIDELAYRFWSVHPTELDEWAKSAPKMPERYKGGIRAWFFACEMRKLLAYEASPPFHVSRSSDGERQWYSARDAASGVSIPLETKERAEALVASLNRSFELHLRLAQAGAQ